MVALVNSFLTCQIIILKYAGFSCQQFADELNSKTNSTAQPVYSRYYRNNNYLPKKSTKELSKKLIAKYIN